MVFQRIEKVAGLPPLKETVALLSGENGKRLNAILARFENLAKDMDTIVEVAKLLQLVKDLNESGALAKLESILGMLPRGKAGETMVTSLRQLVEELGGKIEQLNALASQILSTDK